MCWTNPIPRLFSLHIPPSSDNVQARLPPLSAHLVSPQASGVTKSFSARCNFLASFQNMSSKSRKAVICSSPHLTLVRL